MRRIVFVLVAVVALVGVVAYIGPATGQANGEAAPIFRIKIPAGYRDWRLIAVALVLRDSFELTCSPSRFRFGGSPCRIGAVSGHRSRDVRRVRAEIFLRHAAA